MTTAKTLPSAQEKNPSQAGPAQKRDQALHLRQAIKLADRVRVMMDGSRWFVRFSQAEILEHWAALVVLFILGLSGFFLLFANFPPVAWLTNKVFSTRVNPSSIHDVAAFAWIFALLYHFGRILYVWVVQRRAGSMFPRSQDGSDLLQTIRYFLGRDQEQPKFDRFTIDEKIGYWALLWMSLVMGMTGLIQWFPTFFTQFLPGEIIPVANSIHIYTAVLMAVIVLIWHLYHTLLKERNLSIFSGLMSEHSMQENHALEYANIMAAYEEVQKLKQDAVTPIRDEKAAEPTSADQLA